MKSRSAIDIIVLYILFPPLGVLEFIGSLFATRHKVQSVSTVEDVSSSPHINVAKKNTHIRGTLIGKILVGMLILLGVILYIIHKINIILLYF